MRPARSRLKLSSAGAVTCSLDSTIARLSVRHTPRETRAAAAIRGATRRRGHDVGPRMLQRMLSPRNRAMLHRLGARRLPCLPPSPLHLGVRAALASTVLGAGGALLHPQASSCVVSRVSLLWAAGAFAVRAHTSPRLPYTCIAFGSWLCASWCALHMVGPIGLALARQPEPRAQASKPHLVSIIRH